jgi:twitching motility protein PilT
MAQESFDEIDELLDQVVKLGGSDLHVSSGNFALIRVNGDLRKVSDKPVSNKVMLRWLENMLPESQIAELETHGDIDFAFSFDNGNRFRGSAFRSSGYISIAIRFLNATIPNFEQIGLPPVAQSWANKQTGLIIVTGPTGSGKSTTVASMVNSAHQDTAHHIVTIEDPIEYILPKGKGVVRQREIGIDAHDFPRAIRACLREDADIVVVGEMRDKETIAAAITVAETGHLVFATLHTSSAAQAVDRIIDTFDSASQPLIRSRLSSCLVGVIYQRLVPRVDGGRTAAYEILVANNGIRNMIREGKTHQIPNMMTTGMNEGMQTMEVALQRLTKEGRISKEFASDFLKQNV